MYRFLGGINKELDSIRSDLLAMDPSPSLETAYSTLRRESVRRRIHLAPNLNNEVFGSGLAIKGRSTQSGAEKSTQRRGADENRDDKSGLKCDYCNGTRHTLESCFKMKGYPKW